MRIIHSHLLKYIAVLFAWSLPFASGYATPQPQNYAYGANLITEGNEPFYRLPLSQEVYTQTAWPDLRDVQVFNRRGQAVPMAFQSVVDEQKQVTPIALQVFPLRSRSENSVQSSTYFAIIANDLVEVNVNKLTNKPTGTSYILQLPQDSLPQYNSKLRFKLHWADVGYNWQAKVNVYRSQDFRNWSLIASDEPIMDLTAGNERLLLNDINLSDRYNTANRWLFVITAEPDVIVPALDGVEIIYENSVSTQKMLDLDFTLQSSNDNEAVYVLPTPQPLSSLTIQLPQYNTVMPMLVTYMSEQSTPANWLPLKKLIIYQLYDAPTTITLNEKYLIKMIRLQPINTTWGETPPQMQGQRKKIDVLFNGGSNGPFILAWGAKAAEYTALTVDTLIPMQLRNTIFINQLPQATMADPVTLAGEKTLTTETIAPPKSSPYKWALWVGLFLGALGLAFMAYKLSRELLSDK